MQLFKVTQPVSSRKQTTVSLYFTCESKLTLNTIKFNPFVWAVVGVDGTSLVPDKFQTEQTACPGFLINDHHKLVWKDTLLAQLSEALRSVRVDVSNKVFQRWKQQNPTATTIHELMYIVANYIAKWEMPLESQPAVRTSHVGLPFA